MVDHRVGWALSLQFGLPRCARRGTEAGRPWLWRCRLAYQSFVGGSRRRRIAGAAVRQAE